MIAMKTYLVQVFYHRWPGDKETPGCISCIQMRQPSEKCYISYLLAEAEKLGMPKGHAFEIQTPAVVFYRRERLGDWGAETWDAIMSGKGEDSSIQLAQFALVQDNELARSGPDFAPRWERLAKIIQKILSHYPRALLTPVETGKFQVAADSLILSVEEGAEKAWEAALGWCGPDKELPA